MVVTHIIHTTLLCHQWHQMSNIVHHQHTLPCLTASNAQISPCTDAVHHSTKIAGSTLSCKKRRAKNTQNHIMLLAPICQILLRLYLTVGIRRITHQRTAVLCVVVATHITIHVERRDKDERLRHAHLLQCLAQVDSTFVVYIVESLFLCLRFRVDVRLSSSM